MADVPITVLSGPTVLIEYAGLRLLTDPTFDEPGDYEMSGLPIRKTTAPPTAPTDLGHLDAVLLSHDEHVDNLDRTGRDLLSRVPTTLTTTSAAGRLGGSARGLEPWEEHTLHAADGTAVTITAVPARHGPEGSEPYTGDVTGFVLSAHGHPLVHVSGDNASMDAVREVAARFGPVDTAVLFLGGVSSPAFFDGALLTFDDADAVVATRVLEARRVVPAHLEGWSHYSGGIEQLVATFAEQGLADRLQLTGR